MSRLSQPPSFPPPSRGLSAVAIAVLLFVQGCASYDDLDTSYGKRAGVEGGASVNGTAVLSDLIKARGLHVETRRSLSPSLKEAEVIIWFADNYSAPSKEVCNWFYDWLGQGGNHKLVYVGRDFDAAPLYWQKITPLAKPEVAQEVERRKKRAEMLHNAQRTRELDPDECFWFSLSNDANPRQPKTLTGPWSQGIDPAKTEIYLNGEFTPVEWAQPLLESGDDLIACTYKLDAWQGGEIILIQNGSFLLNFGLVNRENRKLAAKLVDALGDHNVVFLEPPGDDPKILETEPTPQMGSGTQVLYVWPLNAILLHLAVLGIIFCFARFPIFGTPRRPTAVAASDFGLHVDALGDLLAATKNRAYAEGRVAHYRELRGDSR